ncbi:hypothetical protein ABPG72_021062 [Tetrahymena utriculariae]
MILQGYQTKYLLKDKIIGQGGFSQVFQGYILQDDEESDLVAIKKVSKTTSDGKEYKNYLKELEISQKVYKIEREDPCQYIMNIIDFCKDDDSFYIVTQYYESGDFLNFLDQNFEYFTVDIVLDILIQIIIAINYLHKHNITHRDLKPENILISKQQQMYFVKVADFGSATVSDFSSLSGTPNYMAPEIFQNKSISNSIDIWSFGCLAYEILTKQQFFFGRSAQQIVRQILEYNECLYKNQDQNDQYFQIHQLIQKYCLQPDSDKRKTAQFMLDKLSLLRVTHQQELKACDFELISSQDVVFWYGEGQQSNLQTSNEQTVFNNNKSQQNNDINISNSKFEKYKSMDQIQSLSSSQENSLIKIDDKNSLQDQIYLKAGACQDGLQSETENISFSMDGESKFNDDQQQNEIQLENEDNDTLGKKQAIINQENDYNNNIYIQQPSQHDLKNSQSNEDSENLNQNQDETQKITQKLQEDYVQAKAEEIPEIQEFNESNKDKFLLDAWINQSQNNKEEEKQEELMLSNSQISLLHPLNKINQQVVEENNAQEKQFISNQKSELSYQNENSQLRSSELKNQKKKQNYSIFKEIELQFFSKYSINKKSSDKSLREIQNFPLLLNRQIKIPQINNKQINYIKQTDKQNQDSSYKIQLGFLLLPYLLGGISLWFNKQN